eukprot:TRINITY_DN1548_c0_g1_i3.p1 TRINITY_DN1548_c0_g1~~TRINITY_DN1548_c0_g1_i3.p1  ORF type:complete len:437 (+),score=89.48 TRINITY_DN1548_c0_g1_i3:57-1367(+)
MSNEGRTRASSIPADHLPTERYLEDLYTLAIDYEIPDESIGSGTFGVVKRVVHRDTETTYAMKILDKANTPGYEIRKEIALMKELKHANIVGLYEVVQMREHYGIIMEFAAGGTLQSLLPSIGAPTLDVAHHVMVQVFDGLAHMHRAGIIHRDIKLQNLLLEDTEFPTRVMISDLGLSKQIGVDLTATVCGTPFYFAPEVADGQMYSFKADMWSCGILLYILLTGDLPFYDEESGDYDYTKVTLDESLQRYNLRETLPESVLDLVEGLLRLDPETRLSSQEALDHPWIRAESVENITLSVDYKNVTRLSLARFKKAARAIAVVRRLTIGQQNRSRASSIQGNESVAIGSNAVDSDEPTAPIVKETTPQQSVETEAKRETDPQETKTETQAKGIPKPSTAEVSKSPAAPLVTPELEKLRRDHERSQKAIQTSAAAKG